MAHWYAHNILPTTDGAITSHQHVKEGRREFDREDTIMKIYVRLIWDHQSSQWWQQMTIISSSFAHSSMGL